MQTVGTVSRKSKAATKRSVEAKNTWPTHAGHTRIALPLHIHTQHVRHLAGKEQAREQHTCHYAARQVVREQRFQHHCAARHAAQQTGSDVRHALARAFEVLVAGRVGQIVDDVCCHHGFKQIEHSEPRGVGPHAQYLYYDGFCT